MPFQIVWHEYGKEHVITSESLPVSCITDVGKVELEREHEDNDVYVLTVRNTNIYIQEFNLPFRYNQIEVRKKDT